MNQSTEATAADGGPDSPAWRRTLGAALFILANMLWLIALVVLPALGLPESMNAVLLGLSVAGGPDLLIVISIAVMGKENMVRLLESLGSWGKRVLRWDTVSRTRFRIGMAVLTLSVFAPVVLLFTWDSAIRTINGQPGWAYYLLVGTTTTFFASVLAMGAPFWLRLQALFSWDASITIGDTKA